MTLKQETLKKIGSDLEETIKLFKGNEGLSEEWPNKKFRKIMHGNFFSTVIVNEKMIYWAAYVGKLQVLNVWYDRSTKEITLKNLHPELEEYVAKEWIVRETKNLDLLQSLGVF